MSVPPLPEWLRWVSEMPPPFRAAPEKFAEGGVRVRAVVSDLFETLFAAAPGKLLLSACEASSLGPPERNRLGWILAACHVLWHPALRTVKIPRAEIERLLVEELAALAAVVPLDALGRDEERREELVRRVLRASAIELPGEGQAEREDRFKQVDSVERQRVLSAAAEREKRAREVREAIARKAAEEAAAKVSRE